MFSNPLTVESQQLICPFRLYQQIKKTLNKLVTFTYIFLQFKYVF